MNDKELLEQYEDQDLAGENVQQASVAASCCALTTCCCASEICANEC
ncbi:MAG: hypothetical protein K6E59_02280 [Bacilli bacterium]|nr:hypothetical protein [Bacilli bacterium]